MKYKLIICDFDGTLCVTHKAIITCIQETFSFFNKQPPLEKYIRQTIGKTLEESFSILSNGEIEGNSKTSKTWLNKYREIYYNKGQQLTSLFDGVDKVLQEAYKNNIYIVIISNKGVTAISSALDLYNIKKYVSFIVGDMEGLKKKPDPMIFDKIIKPQFSNISKENILMAGDTEIDLIFAKNIGVDSCWCLYGYGDIKACKSLKPDYTISSFEKITNIILK